MTKTISTRRTETVCGMRSQKVTPENLIFILYNTKAKELQTSA